MGLFSGIFGGKKTKVNTTTDVENNISVEPIINIDFDLNALGDQISGSAEELQSGLSVSANNIAFGLIVGAALIVMTRK